MRGGFAAMIFSPLTLILAMDIKQLYKLYQEHPCLTTDSRNCPEGSIFLALRGDTFDGNQFAQAALDQGCAYAIVDRPECATNDRCLLVDDCLATYKQLAREHRRQFQIPVIAITGTNGKTTTKELVAAVLQKKYNVLYTQANYNNDVGVPKTLMRLTADHDIAVIEMGASHPGDIRTLAETAEPTCGLITNVGRAHLQGFGSLKNVVKTKGELYDYLGRRGESLVFLNADNDRLVDMLPDSVWVAPYSANPDNAEGCTTGQVTACNPYLSIRWRESDTDLEERGEEVRWYDVATHLIGDYNLDNLLAAITVGLNFAVSPADICSALEAYEPSNNRSQLTVTAYNRLIVDAYNANPTSMRAAIDNFERIDAEQKMVILGQMNELGESSLREHQKVVDRLATMQLDGGVWLVGDEWQQANTSELEAKGSGLRMFHSVDQVKEAIASDMPQGRSILIKGSNSTRLYQLPALL